MNVYKFFKRCTYIDIDKLGNSLHSKDNLHLNWLGKQYTPIVRTLAYSGGIFIRSAAQEPLLEPSYSAHSWQSRVRLVVSGELADR